MNNTGFDIKVSVTPKKANHAKRFSKQEREEIVAFANSCGWGGKRRAQKRYGVSYCALSRWPGLVKREGVFSTDRLVKTFDLERPTVRSIMSNTIPVNHPKMAVNHVPRPVMPTQNPRISRTSDLIMDEIKSNEQKIKYIQNRNRELARELISIF